MLIMLWLVGKMLQLHTSQLKNVTIYTKKLILNSCGGTS